MFEANDEFLTALYHNRRFVQSALGGGLGQVGKALMAQAATEVLREVLKEHKRWPYVVNKVLRPAVFCTMKIVS